MADDPTKKKQDAKRISLKQKHEVYYLRMKCRELIILCNSVRKSKRSNSRRYVAFDIGEQGIIRFSTSTLARIAKALLLTTKHKRK